MVHRDCFVNEEELNLYLDRELDKNRTSHLDRHRPSCKDCSVRFEIASSLKSLVRESCRATQAPSWLKGKILEGIAREKPGGGEGLWEYLRNLMAHRPFIPVGAASLLVVFFLLVLFSRSRTGANMPLVTEMVHEHYEYLEEPEKLGIRSSDSVEITGWILANVGLEISIDSNPAMPAPEGACALHHDDETIGYVYFENEGKRISLFILEDDGKTLFAPRSVNVDSFSVYCGRCTDMNYALWQGRNMVFVLVGDVPEELLAGMARYII